MTELERPPSDAAWAAIRGAVDLHVHVGPDVIPRRVDDIDLAREFQRHHLGGFVIKSHYIPTAVQAATVTRVVPDVQVAGAITLTLFRKGIPLNREPQQALPGLGRARHRCHAPISRGMLPQFGGRLWGTRDVF